MMLIEIMGGHLDRAQIDCGISAGQSAIRRHALRWSIQEKETNIVAVSQAGYFMALGRGGQGGNSLYFFNIANTSLNKCLP
jgi:hypothetical protein